ncbi:MAG: CDP-diacylglycerol--serine O-phosphatidyltransferase [Blastocatellia bacterium]
MSEPTTTARPPRRGIRKGIYVVPSLFTIGNIFCGFYAVINSLKASQSGLETAAATVFFENAALAIGLAYLLDGLDGRIARLTGATSEFGVELDSIADVISFGIAPAVLAYTWGYGNIPGAEKLGWGVSFLFLICGALRLARFNVLARAPRFEAPGATPKLDKRYFVGLPIPAAAGLTAAFVYFHPAQLPGANGITRNWILMSVVLLVSLLMVSTFRYASFKDLGPRSQQPFLAFPLMAILLFCIYYYSQWMFLLMAIVYVSHGPVLKIWGGLNRLRRVPSAPKPFSEDS